jgi:ribosomal protein S18 acetylase RimI-like enzyme
MVYADLEQNPKIRHIADLSFLYVTRAARGKGVGKTLADEIMQELKKISYIEKVNLRVCSVQTAAVELYQSLGFEIVSEMKKERCVDGKYYDDYKMSLFIR